MNNDSMRFLTFLAPAVSCALGLGVVLLFLQGCQGASSASTDPMVLGQELFAGNCASCHGVSGAGASMMLQGTGIAFNNKQWQQKYTDVQLTNIIKNGQNSMPNFNFTPVEYKALVAYLRTLDETYPEQ